jgi:hypothetical protein
MEAQFLSSALPGSPGPWVEVGGLGGGPCRHSGLGSSGAPRLVCQALLDGHLDQLLLTQAAVQAVFLLSDGWSAPSTDLSRHLFHLSPPRLQRRHLAGRRKQQIRKPCEETRAGLITKCFIRQLCLHARLYFFLAIVQSIIRSFGQMIHSTTHPFPHASIQSTHPSSHPHICSSSHTSVYPPTHIPIHPPSHSPIHPHIQTSKHLPIYSSSYPSVCPSTQPLIHLLSHP